MTLDDALGELDRQNPSVEAARARAEAAQGIVRQAGSALRPTLSATGSYVRNNDEVKISLGAMASVIPGAPNLGTLVIQPLDAWTASATVRVPLIVPQAWYDVDAAEAARNATRQTVDLTRRESRAVFAKLTYGAIALEEVVAASERAVEIATAHAKSAERRVAAGTAAPLDALRANAEVVKRESDRVRAKAELERVRLALGVLLGREAPLKVVATPTQAAKGGTGGSMVRPELRALEARAESERAQLRSAKARVLPQLHATGSIFASDEPYPTQEYWGWRASLELTIPLYDGGYRYGKRDEVEANMRATAAEIAGKRLSIAQDVGNARREVLVSDENLRLSVTRQRLASDAAASAQRSFDAGIGTTFEVLDANDRLYQADVSVADARAKLAQARVELARALGTGP